MNFKNKLKIFLLFAATLIFSVQTANAQEIMQGAALSGIQAMFDVVSNTFFFVAGGIVALLLTTSALQWLITNQTQLINFNNGFVVQGLHITQGLTDMLLLLAFVAVAMGIIFKYRDFEAKKMLPKLIAVAILTRFGPLAVKMMVDIGNLAINTIVSGNANLLSTVMDTLLQDMWWMIGTMLTAIAAKAVLFSIPFFNGVTLAGFLAGLGAGGSAILAAAAGLSVAGPLVYFGVNFITKWVFQLFASYMLAGVFVTYIILFASRIFMLQILAVISPLAILSYALPQTQKYFGQWRDSLFKWTFVGVWTLFFLMLGLGSSGFILPDVPHFNSNLLTGVLSGFGIDRYMLYYLFLIVYLSLVESMAQKDAGMSNIFRSAMMGGGMAAFTHLIKPAAGKVNSYAMQQYASAKGRISATPENQNPNIADTIIMHTAGSVEKITDAKTMSGMRNIFSGDEGRISGTTSRDSKGFELFGATRKGWGGIKATNIDPSVSAKLNEMAKDLTMDQVLAEGAKVPEMKAMAMLRQNIGKKDEAPNVQQLVENLGDKAGPIIGTMVSQKLLTPSQTQWLSTNTDLISKSAGFAQSINTQDRNNSYLRKIQLLRGGVATNEQDKKDEAEMLALTLSYKDMSFKKDALAGLSPSLFEDSGNLNAALAAAENAANRKKRLALLVGGNRGLFGKALNVNENWYKKLGNDIGSMAIADFTKFAKANPDLARQMAESRERKFLPQFLQNPDGTINTPELERIITT
jgi:hypothetical protein